MAEDHNPNIALAAQIAAALHEQALMRIPDTEAAFIQKLASGKAKAEDWKAVLQASISSTQNPAGNEASATTN